MFWNAISSDRNGKKYIRIKDANSSEFSNCENSIVGLMTEWTTSDNTLLKRDLKMTTLGGTMRLGSYEAKLKKGSKIYNIYKDEIINERHRHQYEVNNKFAEEFENKGVIFSGYSPDGLLPETVELKIIHGLLEFNITLN